MHTRFCLLLVAAMLLGNALPAAAHDSVGSSDFALIVPNEPLSSSIIFVTLVGPAAGEDVLHATWNLTFSSPPNGTKASDVILELSLPLQTGMVTWELSGSDLGWPAATGKYSGTIGSDQLDGVLDAGPFGFTAPELVVSSLSGGVTGQFLHSTIVLELAPAVCQADLGHAGPGSVTLDVCGDTLGSGGNAELSVQGAPAFAPVFLAAGAAQGNAPFKGGTLVPIPVLVVLPLLSDAAGKVSLEVPGGGGPATAYVQAIVQDPSSPAGWSLSNAIELALLP